jgi:predicted RNA binding protein YcfA (HicA-like mRNA interferase family)
MGRYPVLKPSEVVTILNKTGFSQVRHKGSHKQYRHPDGAPQLFLFIRDGIYLQLF